MFFFREIDRGHIVKCKQITNFTRFSENRGENLWNQKRRVYEHFWIICISVKDGTIFLVSSCRISISCKIMTLMRIWAEYDCSLCHKSHIFGAMHKHTLELSLRCLDLLLHICSNHIWPNITSLLPHWGKVYSQLGNFGEFWHLVILVISDEFYCIVDGV